MNKDFVKYAKVFGLVIVGFFIGVIVSSKYHITIKGTSSSAYSLTCADLTPPPISAPPGKHWACDDFPYGPSGWYLQKDSNGFDGEEEFQMLQ